MTLSRLDVSALRARLHEVGFRGSVRSIDDLGSIERRDILCAVLHCSNAGPDQVFVNTEINCDHAHLTIDVMKLVEAYANGDLDNGWAVQPNGDASTAIATRDSVIRAGIPRSDWAPSPAPKGV